MNNVDFNEKKFVNSLNIDVPVGSFAKNSVPLYFESCRERFSTRWEQTDDGIFFTHSKGRGRNIANFIRKTEEVLQESDKTQFSETNVDTILWIEPSCFWKCCRVRRSLFTILLRAGHSYCPESDNYESTLFQHPYVSSTKMAVQRFLFGFTKYIGDPIDGQIVETRGWVKVFENRDVAFIKTVLVSPYHGGSLIRDANHVLWV